MFSWVRRGDSRTVGERLGGEARTVKKTEQREEGSILDDEGAIFFERGEQATRGRFLRGEENELGKGKQRVNWYLRELKQNKEN